MKAGCNVWKLMIETLLKILEKFWKKICLKFVFNTSGNAFAFKSHVSYAGYKGD